MFEGGSMNISDIKSELNRLMCNFNRPFINDRWELILVPRHNIYFRLEDIESVEDLNCKVFAWVSRSATKGVPIKTQNEIRKNLNKYFGVSFKLEEWDLIYTRLGNGCNGSLCREFVRSGYDIEVL